MAINIISTGVTDMNTTLSEVLMKSCVGPAPLSDRLALEYMMLVAILHHRVGQEVGKYCVKYKAKIIFFNSCPSQLNFPMLYAHTAIRVIHVNPVVIKVLYLLYKKIFFRCSCCTEPC